MGRVERDGWDREGDLRQIEATYARYEREDRDALWSLENAGYGRTAHELDVETIGAIRRSLEKESRNVLDLGCGSGDLMWQARKAGLAATWTGVDLRPPAVETAAERLPDVDFVVASADNLPFADAAFDVVVAKVLFSSLPSRPLESAVADEVGRILKPGGWLVWLDLRYDNPSNRAVHAINRRRLSQLFPGWRQELHTAGLLPPLARRLGPLTTLLHRRLSALSPLHSHLVGRLQHP